MYVSKCNFNSIFWAVRVFVSIIHLIIHFSMYLQWETTSLGMCPIRVNPSTRSWSHKTQKLAFTWLQTTTLVETATLSASSTESSALTPQTVLSTKSQEWTLVWNVSAKGLWLCPSRVTFAMQRRSRIIRYGSRWGDSRGGNYQWGVRHTGVE